MNVSHPDLAAVAPLMPLYVQVKEAVRSRILGGKYKPYQQMPSESNLMAEHNVSRTTVRQALRDLQRDGLIFKIPGKGTFVSKPKAIQDISRLEGFGEAMTPKGYDTFSIVAGYKESVDDHEGEKIKTLLGIRNIAELRRIRYLNREPISLDVTYLPSSLATRLISEDLANKDIFLILENEYGMPLGRADLTIESILADDSVSRVLHIEEGAPVLKMERLTYLSDGSPIDYELLFYRGDAFKYRLAIERAGGRRHG